MDTARDYINSIDFSNIINKMVRHQGWRQKDALAVSRMYRHFLWLHKHKDPVDPSQRFLVMGNCAPGAGAGEQTILEKLLADNNNTPVVAQAIIALTDVTDATWTQFIRINRTATKLRVTRHEVHK